MRVRFGGVSAEFIHQRLHQRFLHSWRSARSSCLLVCPSAEQLSCGFLKRQHVVVGRAVAGGREAWSPTLGSPSAGQNKPSDFQQGTLCPPVNQTTRWPSRSFPPTLLGLFPSPLESRAPGIERGGSRYFCWFALDLGGHRRHGGFLAPRSFRTQETSGTIQSSGYQGGLCLSPQNSSLTTQMRIKWRIPYWIWAPQSGLWSAHLTPGQLRHVHAVAVAQI